MLKRMETKISFDHSTDALKRFESVSDPPRDLDDTLEDSEEDEGTIELNTGSTLRPCCFRPLKIPLG